MAISRGAGTEIIRSAHFEDIDGSVSTKLIFGVQHHIYTVLSISIYCSALNATSDIVDIKLTGYDAKAGTTAQDVMLCRYTPTVDSTFVWNDKFSFNGHEPTDFTGPMDDATEQDAIADQGSSVAQYLHLSSTHASDSFEVFVTFVDQNNS